MTPAKNAMYELEQLKVGKYPCVLYTFVPLLLLVCENILILFTVNMNIHNGCTL